MLSTLSGGIFLSSIGVPRRGQRIRQFRVKMVTSYVQSVDQQKRYEGIDAYLIPEKVADAPSTAKSQLLCCAINAAPNLDKTMEGN
jgi:hypothetical protein